MSFDPDAFASTVEQMLADTARCRVLLRTNFVEATTGGMRVESIRAVSHSGAAYRIHARVFVDSTGGAYLCRALGCEVSLDVHGAGHGRIRGRQSAPYGIPYRCLIPKGRTNLLVACRGASFSQIAASSCRLSRTMIALGHAAGLAAAMAAQNHVPVTQIDVPTLQRRLGMPP